MINRRLDRDCPRAIATRRRRGNRPCGAGAGQDTLAKIKARGKLFAGVKFDTPPFGYLDDKNEPVGFDLDLVRKVAEHIGVPVEFVKVTSHDPHTAAGQRQCRSVRGVDDAHARARQDDRFLHHVLHRRPVADGAQVEHDHTASRISTASRSRCSRARRWKRTSPRLRRKPRSSPSRITTAPGWRWRRAASTR